MSETKHKIWIITLFPDMFTSFLDLGVAGQTFTGNRGLNFEVSCIKLSDYSPKDFKGVDSAPYGGGQGMIMRPDVLKAALVNGVVAQGDYGRDYKSKLHVVYTGPRGNMWTNDYCKSFAERAWSHGSKDLVFICGRYEGIDERFLDEYVDETVSIGDFILTGGELAVMTILDSAVRFTRESLGNSDSAKLDSFNDGLLEHPQYTRPNEFDGKFPPYVLTSGNHSKISQFQHEEKIRITKKYRSDLYQKYLENK